MADGKIDPMHQFQITEIAPLNIGGINLAITNSTIFMFLAAALIVAFFWAAASRGAMVPTRLQSMGELGYEFVADMIRSMAGEEGLKFFPFVFTLFFFVFVANLLGMVPYFLTTTSHIVVTGVLALAVFALVTVVGFLHNGSGFLKLFAPAGAPWWIYFLLIPIEIISYFARPITHSFRLFANMLAGHIMLKILASFVLALSGAGIWISISWLPFVLAIAITGLEFLVAFLQAYVFAILTCAYLNDALHPSH